MMEIKRGPSIGAKRTVFFHRADLTDFRTWLKTPTAQALIQTEALHMSPWVKRVFGYHCVMLGEPEWAYCMQDNPIHHTICVNPTLPMPSELTLVLAPETASGLSSLVSEWHQLPIDQDSVDIVFLAHALEQHAYSHDILREAQRILIPQGHLVIAAFNPFSCFGLVKPILSVAEHSFWRAKWIALMRIKDWLALLGFTILETKTVFFRGPCRLFSQRESSIAIDNLYEKLCQKVVPYLGSSLLILAQKSVVPLTPIRPKWASLRPKLVPDGGLEPTVNEAAGGLPRR